METHGGRAIADGGETASAVAARPIRLDGAELTTNRHVCAFFHDAEEHRRLLMPFIRDALERGERAYEIIDPRLVDEHRARLNEAGIDVDNAIDRGALRIATWPEAYLAGGHFDQDRMLGHIEEALAGGPPGFPITRLVADMEWALEDAPGVGDLAEYEARLNEILPRYAEHPVICTYDLQRFDAGTVVDILRTHPMAVVGGTLHENPYYVEPAAMRAEVAARASRDDR